MNQLLTLHLELNNIQTFILKQSFLLNQLLQNIQLILQDD